jgi:hypothetical protein
MINIMVANEALSWEESMSLYLLPLERAKDFIQVELKMMVHVKAKTGSEVWGGPCPKLFN